MLPRVISKGMQLLFCKSGMVKVISFNQPLLGFVKVSSVSVPIIAVLCPFPLLVSKRVYSTMHCIQSGKDGSNRHI